MGHIKTPTVDAAKSMLAAARVEYLRARQQASQSAGGKELAALNGRLADLNMQAVQQRAIGQATGQKIEGLKSQLAEQLHAEMSTGRIKQRISLLESQIAMLAKRLALMELEVETVPPVTITPWAE